MRDYLTMDAGRVRIDIERLVEAFPELADDDELRADMVEGQTDIDAMLTRLFKAWRLDEGMAAGTKDMLADLKERKARFERRAAAKKALAQSLMEAADLDKRELPVATFSIRSGSVSVVIDDPEQLPQGAYRLVREPIGKPELRKMIEAAGHDFPGAHLDIGDDTIAVRAK